MRWPALPKIIYGTGGSITVVEVEQPKAEDNAEVEGTWEPDTRTIELKRDLLPRRKWLIFYHELMHATLADSGIVNLLPDESQEALCDAIATARVVEMVGSVIPRYDKKSASPETKST